MCVSPCVHIPVHLRPFLSLSVQPVIRGDNITLFEILFLQIVGVNRGEEEEEEEGDGFKGGARWV